MNWGGVIKPVLLYFKIGYYVPKHKDFLINVLLGLSASSFISWICVCLPVKLKLKNQLHEAIKDCAYILQEYMFLRVFIVEWIKPSYIERNEECGLILAFEEEIKRKAEKLKARIYDVSNSYWHGDIENDSISKILDLYNDELYANLDVIIAFIDFIYIIVGKDDKGMYSEQGIKRYARLSSSIIETLFISLDLYLSTEDLIKEFNAIFPEEYYKKKEFMQLHWRETLLQTIDPQNSENTRKRLIRINTLQKRLIKILEEDVKNGNM